jgi:hypothetical protein
MTEFLLLHSDPSMSNRLIRLKQRSCQFFYMNYALNGDKKGLKEKKVVTE